jgi:hypothetical protein
MPEKEPNINRKDLKSEGKLTPDEAKAMVQKFKKEHEGLLPEYFSLPGEENEEKEREYPEELLIYYEMKEQLKPIEEKLKDDTLRKNMIKGISENIEKGQQEKNTFSAWFVFLGYISLLSYPEFNEIKSQFPEEIKKIEEGLKDKTIRKNVTEQISKSIQEHQKEKDAYFAWVVFLNDYTSLFSYLNHLYKVGQKKLAEIESQKAIHPELRKNLPPIPEEKMF